MTTARMTFGTVLSTVSDAATSVSTVLNAATKGVGMLDTFVTNAATKQRVRSLIDMESFETRLLEEVAQEDTERQIKLKEFTAQSADHADLFKSNYERLQAILHPSK